MSIVNLYKSGLKDQDTVVDNLTVNEDAIVNGDLTVNGSFNPSGNLIVNGYVKANNSAISGTLSEVVVSAGIFSIASGVGPGVSPLVISGLLGNSGSIYKLYASFSIQATNGTNYITLQLNSDSSGYANHITRENASSPSSLTTIINNPDNSGLDTRFALISANLAVTYGGVGEWILWLNKANVNQNPCLTGQYSTKIASSGNYVYTYNASNFQQRPNGTQITSITIDTNSSDHTGIGIYYKLTKLF